MALRKKNRDTLYFYRTVIYTVLLYTTSFDHHKNPVK